MKQFNIAIFYDPDSNATNTVYDYLNAFRLYSKFSISYSAIDYYIDRKIDIDDFDATIIFYSTSAQIRHFNENHPMSEALRSFAGPKIAILQDEYDHMVLAPHVFSAWGVTHIVTNMPEGYERVVYPESVLGNVKFIHALTGYVPDNLLVALPQKPMDQRSTLIGYRGRPLHYKYGHLGQEKIDVGRKMREICMARNIAVDIEWTEDKRIYGDAWPGFIANCRVMLGSESGSEVFDPTGKLREEIDCYLQAHPSASFNDISEIFLKNLDGAVPMAQNIAQGF